MSSRAGSIYVAGHQGMVGSALVRRLQAGGYGPIVTRTRAELDLTDSRAVQAFLAESYNRQYGRQYLSVMPINLCGPNANHEGLNYRQQEGNKMGRTSAWAASGGAGTVPR